MANVHKALTGKRVYRSSSYAPTRGTNNPKGYIKRELLRRNAPHKRQAVQPRKKAQPLVKQKPGQHGVSKVGNDGQSDTRSGMAARTLRVVPNKKKKHKRRGQLQRAPLVTPQYKPISINSNGRLDLPFDYAAGQAALEKTQQANQNLLDLQQQSQQHAAQYLQTMRNAGQQYGQQKIDILNQDAGRGAAFSSGYGLHVGRNATAYNNQVGDLNTENTQFNNGVTAQRNGITADLNDFLRQQALQRGVQLGGQAGTLGYGKSRALPAMRKPRKKRRRK